jgi:DNA invertase Pin-like site-specific DNA recombinase
MQRARDVVVVRVSEQGGRDEESFHSPKAQLAKAGLWSEDQGNRVVDAFEEIDVSGKLPLARRPGLLKAIEMVEAGEADHIVVAYFDRLVRSLKVQLEVIERVEQAGGEIYAIDLGGLTNGTAATRMSNNMMGAAFQYYAEATGEKVAAARERVVARGVLPTSRISPGYVRGEDGVLVVERPKARIVVQAFKRRDRGASLVEIQGVAGQEWDRALDLRRGVDAALADVPRRDPFRRAAQHARTSRSLRIVACSSARSGGRSRAGAKPTPSGCWPAWRCRAAGRAGRGW